MASQLTRDEVARIAGLAHLELTPDELDVFARQLTDILAYAAIVQEAAFADATAGTSESHVESPLMRPDTPLPSLDRAAVLAEAPDAAHASGLFRVPRVR